MTIDELAMLGTEASEDVISIFAKRYFGKEIKDLTKEDNHEIDCFGIYGIHEWLDDNPEINKGK